MRALLMFGAVLCCSCETTAIVPGGPVGGIPPGCPALPDRATFDFFGEPCTALPYPVNLVCRADGSIATIHGWCIGPAGGGIGVCRPMPFDTSGCLLCPENTVRLAPAGAAYCAP